MLGLFIMQAFSDIFAVCKFLVKLAIVAALMLAPYALDASMDKWLGNSLPPTCETEKKP